MSEKRYPYPVQMASIKKGDWRLDSLLSPDLSPQQQAQREEALFQQLALQAENASHPPETHPAFTGSRLIAYGWEWAVYQIPEAEEVVKVPAGIFPEVSEEAYLTNTEYAYQACVSHLKDQVVHTTFERMTYQGEHLSVIRQPLLSGSQFLEIQTENICKKLAKEFIRFGNGLQSLFGEYEWLPDVALKQIDEDDPHRWQIRNVMWVSDTLKLFDFTAYYDVFRLDPSRFKEESQIKLAAWDLFRSRLS